MMTSINDIKQLREETGIGMMDCKKALQECGGDIQKAKIYLREQGKWKRGDRAHKIASEGTIGTYKHTGGRICVMVEVNCETDFVARSGDFQDFAHDLAMHIAATNPKWLSREDIPQELIEQERSILSKGLDGKPQNVIDKIVDGKLSKYFKEVCLLDQQFVKDAKITIQDLYNDICMKVGEKVIIKKFIRFEVGS